MLIAQADSQLVCSDVKLALLDSLAPDHDITVLQRLGCPTSASSPSRWLTSIERWSPTISRHCSSTPATSQSDPELARLVALTERLRGPGGCPWDAAQTHHSLRRHVLEEAYEVVEAIELLPPHAPSGEIPIGAYDALEDELGDLLFQVMIQSVLASEAGAFTIADVARAVHAKLVRRHPHVFGDVRVSDANEVVTNWEQIKKTEHDDQSLVAGVTAGLPALIAAQKFVPQRRIHRSRTRSRPCSTPSGSLTDADGADLEPALGAALAAVVPRSAVNTTSTPNRPWRAGRAATKRSSAGWNSSRSRPMSTSRTASAAQVRELWYAPRRGA